MDTPMNEHEAEKGQKSTTPRKKYKVFHVYFEDAEALKQVEMAAKKHGLQASSWARMVLMREAKSVLSD